MQAAKRFGVNRATFNRWVADGKIPVAVALDGQTGARLFDADVIDQLAAKYLAAEADQGGAA